MTSSRASTTRPDLFGLAVLAVMFAIPAGTITAPLSEYDTGWHLPPGNGS